MEYLYVAEHEGETYVFDFDPSCAQDIDEDVEHLHQEWTWMASNSKNEYLLRSVKTFKRSNARNS